MSILYNDKILTLSTADCPRQSVFSETGEALSSGFFFREGVVRILF